MIVSSGFALSVALVGALTTAVPHGSEGNPWAIDTFWVGMQVDVPVTLHLRLGEVGISDRTGTFGMRGNVLSLGIDFARPSGPGASLSLSFLQTPLIAILTLSMIDHPSRAMRVLGSTLLWLSGGALEWAPGGFGNLRRSRQDATTLSLVLRQDFAVHPFAGPVYIRDTVGLGIMVRWDRPWGRPQDAYPVPHRVCGFGALVSAAADRAGARSLTPGGWASCSYYFWD